MNVCPVTANGRTFIVTARTLKQAIRCASVHVAFQSQAQVIERVCRIA